MRAEKAFNSAIALAERLIAADKLPVEERYSFYSLRRDVAGMLALGSEITPSLDSLEGIKNLTRRLYDPEARLNTQEQAWMVLAARANLVNQAGLNITMNEEEVSGSLSLNMDTRTLSAAPVTIANKGDKSLVAQITTIGTPLKALPASGKGFVIGRSYHHLDGSPASISEVKQNERLVVVINVSQLADIPSRIMVSDLLPAGLEVENPHLIKSADLSGFSWLPKTDIAHLEFRDDRILAAIDRNRGGADRLHLCLYGSGSHSGAPICSQLPWWKTCTGPKNQLVQPAAGWTVVRH